MKNKNTKPFTFKISLSILEQLGRGLYRNFITILGEAISNSWDADASNVWITTEEDEFIIKDDGVGMNRKDFQGKFLKIGYSKRQENHLAKSDKGRPFIGRKGIGKLALLSCAKKISILTKTKRGKHIGGTIINAKLNSAIKRDLQPDKYSLESADKKALAKYTSCHEHGTIIRFQGLNKGVSNSDDFLKKAIAMYFRFSLMDENFHIHLNGREITVKDLKKLIGETQFLWEINQQENDVLFEKLKKKAKETGHVEVSHSSIKGFIASVNVPSDLNIYGTSEKVGVDFYVNGRLREFNLLRGSFLTQHVASYLYGQIHYNELDSKDIDPFTTSREGVRPDNQDYTDFIEKLQQPLSNIANQWDEWRRKQRVDGDPENAKKIPKHQRRIEESKNARVQDFEKKINRTSLPPETKKRLKDKLEEQSFSNTLIYQDLFILENLFREYIKTRGLNSFSDIENKCDEISKIKKYMSYAEKIQDCISHAKNNKKKKR